MMNELAFKGRKTMADVICARCDQAVEESETETIEYVTYCEKCADKYKREEKEKKRKAKQEEREKIKEREYNKAKRKKEESLNNFYKSVVIGEDHSSHICLTCQNYVEVRKICKIFKMHVHDNIEKCSKFIKQSLK